MVLLTKDSSKNTEDLFTYNHNNRSIDKLTINEKILFCFFASRDDFLRVSFFMESFSVLLYAVFFTNVYSNNEYYELFDYGIKSVQIASNKCNSKGRYLASVHFVEEVNALNELCEVLSISITSVREV